MKNEIEELIRLFSKLKEQAEINGIDKDDEDFFKNINMLIGSYELIKDDISDELLEELSLSLKEVIQELILELKEELGEDYQTNNKFSKSIDEIDELLKKSDLSASEIDRLLDERIKKKHNK